MIKLCFYLKTIFKTNIKTKFNYFVLIFLMSSLFAFSYGLEDVEIKNAELVYSYFPEDSFLVSVESDVESNLGDEKEFNNVISQSEDYFLIRDMDLFKNDIKNYEIGFYFQVKPDLDVYYLEENFNFYSIYEHASTFENYDGIIYFYNARTQYNFRDCWDYKYDRDDLHYFDGDTIIIRNYEQRKILANSLTVSSPIGYIYHVNLDRDFTINDSFFLENMSEKVLNEYDLPGIFTNVFDPYRELSTNAVPSYNTFTPIPYDVYILFNNVLIGMIIFCMVIFSVSLILSSFLNLKKNSERDKVLNTLGYSYLMMAAFEGVGGLFTGIISSTIFLIVYSLVTFILSFFFKFNIFNPAVIGISFGLIILVIFVSTFPYLIHYLSERKIKQITKQK